ncbi:MAG: class I SAM-dependent methyltransferase [Dehalococcoidia bacterium]
MTDPKARAIERFAHADTGAIDATMQVILETATDTPLVIRTLLDAARPNVHDGATICELGFGTPGWLLDELRRAFPTTTLHGLDLSVPFGRHAHDLHGDAVRIVVGDMERLPFRDESFDVIYTCWTLYFMPDIDTALAGMRDALRPGGRLITATNHVDHMQEYEDLATEALQRILGRKPEQDMGDRFSVENGGDFLRRHFSDVTVNSYEGEMVLRDPAHFGPFWDAYGAGPLAAEERAPVLAELQRLAAAHIAKSGAFRMRRRGGVLVGIR